MGYIAISQPGMLDPDAAFNPSDIESQVSGPLYETNVLLFAPAVSVAPVGLPLVIRIQDGPGPTPAHYLEATIPAGQYFAAPAIGSMFIAENAPIFIRLISGPTGANAASWLTGYFEVTDGVSVAPTPDLNKSTFEQMVSRIINRGTQFDIFIPAAVRQAIKFFETGNNFPYMKRIFTTLKDPNGSTTEASRDVVLGQDIKRLDSVRRYDPAATSRNYTPITGVQEDDVEELKAGTTPDFYTTTFEDSTEDVYSGPAFVLHLGCLSFASAFQFEAIIWRYTNYKNIRLYDDHWLITNGEMVVLGQTMINLAPIIRQPEIVAYWQPIVAMGLRNLLAAADEMEVDQHAQQIGY